MMASEEILFKNVQVIDEIETRRFRPMFWFKMVRYPQLKEGGGLAK